MSQKELNISKKVMAEIHDKRITMRPRIYFVLGSLLSIVGLVSSFLSALFLFSIVRFTLRSHGPMAQYRFEELLTSFPWWAAALGIISLISGLFLLKNYDISYKKNFKLLAMGIIIALISTVYVLEYFKLDDLWLRHPSMQGLMRQYQYNSEESNQNNTNPWHQERKGRRSK